MLSFIDHDNKTIYPAYKKCNKCGKLKNHSEFHHDNKSKDGYFGRCKKCQSKANKEYRNTKKENK